MNLSVVVRCGDDKRVLDCVSSIDENVDVVVALSSNEVLQAELEDAGFRYCLTPRGNLSMTSNIGLEHARYDRAIITDSDTWFEPGCISSICEGLKDHPVVRAPIRFQHGDSLPSQMVAQARDFVNTLPLSFTPGLGIDKGIRERIGGFIFNDAVPFAVDADLDFRLRRAGIRPRFVDRCIYHSRESLSHDLRAAYRIGSGCCTSYLYHRCDSGNGIKCRSLKAVPLSRLPDVVRRKGLAVATYQLVWDTVYWTGFIRRYARGRTAV